jgi:release factor glutamine methyltransferase
MVKNLKSLGVVRSIGQKIPFLLDNKVEKSIINRLRSVGCIFAEEETKLLILEACSLEDLMKMAEIRASGVPLEYVLGFTTFCGLRIEVSRGVFVPRQRTEFLVKQAKALTRTCDIVVDLCCGSGAVGAAIAIDSYRILLHSVDIDPVAVQCASNNLTKIGGLVYEGDLYNALPHTLRRRVNIIVANAPYVPTDSIELLPQEARFYEPRLALDGGKDGLDLQRKVAEEAPHWLAPGGHLLVETSQSQVTQTLEIFTNAGLTTKIARYEELDATVVIGTNSGHLI